MNKLVLCVFIIWKYIQKIEEKEKLNNKKKENTICKPTQKKGLIFF